MSGCIYLATNLITGKKYVGQHNKPDPIQRIKTHDWDSRRDRCTYFDKSIAKYGIKTFKFETLCVVPHEGLSNMEAYWAEQLETYVWDSPGGYNKMLCGIKFIKVSPETCTKISTANKKRKVNQQTREKMAAVHKNRSEKDRLEISAKLSTAAKNRKPISEKARANMAAAAKLREQKKKAQQLSLTQPATN